MICIRICHRYRFCQCRIEVAGDKKVLIVLCCYLMSTKKEQCDELKWTWDSEKLQWSHLALLITVYAAACPPGDGRMNVIGHFWPELIASSCVVSCAFSWMPDNWIVTKMLEMLSREDDGLNIYLSCLAIKMLPVTGSLRSTAISELVFIQWLPINFFMIVVSHFSGI